MSDKIVKQLAALGMVDKAKTLPALTGEKAAYQTKDIKNGVSFVALTTRQADAEKNALRYPGLTGEELKLAQARDQEAAYKVFLAMLDEYKDNPLALKRLSITTGKDGLATFRPVIKQGALARVKIEDAARLAKVTPDEYIKMLAKIHAEDEAASIKLTAEVKGIVGTPETKKK